MRRRGIGLVLVGWLLVGCASAGTVARPTVTVYKSPQKTFQEYQADEQACRRYAQEGLEATEGSNSLSPAMRVALPGVLGVGGSVLGQATGQPAVGAVIGGTGGAVAGSVMAAQARTPHVSGAQQEVNARYSVCMDAAGHRVPGNSPAQR
jgi:hypothetical protein